MPLLEWFHSNDYGVKSVFPKIQYRGSCINFDSKWKQEALNPTWNIDVISYYICT